MQWIAWTQGGLSAFLAGIHSWDGFQMLNLTNYYKKNYGFEHLFFNFAGPHEIDWLTKYNRVD